MANRDLARRHIVWCALYCALGCESRSFTPSPLTREAATPSIRPAGGGTSADSGSSACDETALPAAELTRFAVIGDYGTASPAEAAVAAMVKSWQPEFVLTTGDNNYPSGSAATIDANIGQFYREFICPYRGNWGAGATRNRFFPALGNHDWYTTDAAPYLDYFALPGNERYYELGWRHVQVFVLDSDDHEPDGVIADSKQAQWLKQRLASSTARWKLVTMHHPPFSSGPHASTSYMQWPFKEWGASLVLAGHDHTYERLQVADLSYVVLGVSGASLYAFSSPVAGSELRDNQSYGAGLFEATAEQLHVRMFAADRRQIDDFVLAD